MSVAKYMHDAIQQTGPVYRGEICGATFIWNFRDRRGGFIRPDSCYQVGCHCSVAMVAEDEASYRLQRSRMSRCPPLTS